MAKATKKTVAKKAEEKPVKTPVAKKAPAKKAVAKKAAAPKAPAVKAAPAAKATPAAKPKTISAQERYHMIDEAAYYRAEKSGFTADAHENWVAAEKEIEELMAKQNIVVKG